MALLSNLGLFFVFYLPLTYAVGLPFDFYVGRYQSTAEETAFFNWIVVAWPLLIPSILALPAAHIVLGIARRLGEKFSPEGLRNICTAAIPLSFLAIHLAIWGDVVVSIQLLITILVPGALLGRVARIPKPRSRLA